MPRRPKTHKPPGAPARPATPRASARERGYDWRWQKARAAFLAAHPLCAECEREGRLTAATVVDHVVPHKGDQELFWRESNWAPMCAACHDRKTATHDGAFGRPLRPLPHLAQEQEGQQDYRQGDLRQGEGDAAKAPA